MADLDTADTADTAEPESVAVSRRDIKAVVAVEGSVAAGPTYRITAPKTGTVHYGSVLAGSHAGTVNLGKGEQPFRVGDEAAKVPVESILKKTLVPDGARVHKGVPVVEVAYAGFGLRGRLPKASAYRLLSGDMSATAAITDGPAGFDCTLLVASKAPAEPGEEGPEILCAIPDDVRVYNGLSGLIIVASGQVDEALALPTSAVSGSAVTGEVTVVNDDGSTEVRKVGLGVTDGAIVEITHGLSKSDRVAVTPPRPVR
ncbi:hypothetical protein E1267_02015 [Nonomuraea longispora]|uniref:Multidrug resistance protein MdtA-like C-terminal permuted SH3 domain-containing protein n=1 Tax=Nonomuraea longispora TaxID=1848320 RepID=A0A4R4NSV9_9ACTN|nr:efflux RND transporter periplasmic adaptor subunit [Nonomuraea longispora]TDC10997.1 hypothetical protein E1267_02015 [Nonomuraea longispora]